MEESWFGKGFVALTGIGIASLLLSLATADVVAVEEVGVGFLPPPQVPTGLFPGSADIVPVTTSLTGSGMLHDVEGSLRPPISPGQVSMPPSWVLQLLIIWVRVAVSQPARKSAWRE